MSKYLVVVADASRARFFSLTNTKQPRFKSGPRLKEIAELANPEAKRRDSELFTDTRSGGNRAPSGPSHAYDDHRNNHNAEFARRFAKKISAAMNTHFDAVAPDSVVVAASHKMLGMIRQAIPKSLKTQVAISETASDLTGMTPDDIQAVLAGEEQLPPAAPPSAS